jgi:hypothetical protein
MFERISEEAVAVYFKMSSTHLPRRFEVNTKTFMKTDDVPTETEN